MGLKLGCLPKMKGIPERQQSISKREIYFKVRLKGCLSGALSRKPIHCGTHGWIFKPAWFVAPSVDSKRNPQAGRTTWV